MNENGARHAHWTRKSLICATCVQYVWWILSFDIYLFNVFAFYERIKGNGLGPLVLGLVWTQSLTLYKCGCERSELSRMFGENLIKITAFARFSMFYVYFSFDFVSSFIVIRIPIWRVLRFPISWYNIGKIVFAFVQGKTTITRFPLISIHIPLLPA